MGITNSCALELANIGSQACEKTNPFMDVVSLLFTLPSFSFATMVEAATESKYTDAIKEGKMYPLHGVVEMEDQSEDAQYYESPVGDRNPRRLGKYRYTFKFNKTMEVHKALQSFRNAKLNVFLLDSAGNICGYMPDGVIFKGFTIGMINPEKMTLAGQDNTPAWTPLAIDLYDAKEWNEKGIAIMPSWYASQLQPVSDVEITVVSKSAANIKLKVAYFDGINSDGSDKLIGIPGIVQTDFVFTTTAPTALQMVDNGDGTYDFPGVNMVSGSVTLKTPKLATSGGDPIKAVAPATITIS